MARNFGRLVQQLRSERSALEREVAKLTQAISALEGNEGRGRQGGKLASVRRARRKMSAAARRAVSLRMKKYWAARKSPSSDSVAAESLQAGPRRSASPPGAENDPRPNHARAITLSEGRTPSITKR